MKRKSLMSIALVLVGMLTLGSCYYDNPLPIEPITPSDVSFSTHIIPILERGCSTANCHDGTEEPRLTSDVAWIELRSGYINTTLPDESSLYKSVAFISGPEPMPPGGPQIPELDQTLILAWIQNGAPND